MLSQDQFQPNQTKPNVANQLVTDKHFLFLANLVIEENSLFKKLRSKNENRHACAKMLRSVGNWSKPQTQENE